MRALVTGATGFVGFHVAKLLREQGLAVRALVRRGSSAVPLAALGVEPVIGDVRDLHSLQRAVKGCRCLFHLAADYRLWVPDPETMYDINVGGTRNALQAAFVEGVERVVYTSTVGVLKTSVDGSIANEEQRIPADAMVGHYKRSKHRAEEEVYRFIEAGLPAVIVNPSTPIGPMDRKPTPTGKIIVDFLNGKIPAYLDTGMNFVDVADVAMGHWLAACRGRIGERYILGNRNLSLREFFEILAGVTRRRAPRIRLPYVPVLLAAYVSEALANTVTGRHPAIPLTGVKMARRYMYFDCSKAVQELDMPQTPVEQAVERAVAWFRENGYAGMVVKRRSAG
ncbi:MAG: hopanoid-associated sugar epimerase [Nitrospirota bacterium]